MIFMVVLLVALTACQTTPPRVEVITLPSFDTVRPDRPVLRDVDLEDAPVPEELLLNYNDLATYAINLEKYFWGDPEKERIGAEETYKQIISIYTDLLAGKE